MTKKKKNAKPRPASDGASSSSSGVVATPSSDWSKASLTELRSRVRGVAFDIDDTLSTHGKLRPEAYTALWRLREAGFILVAVTGRPAGWCDQIARFWPVHAVIGENGAFSFFMDQEGVRRRLNTPGAHADAKSRLRDLGSLIQNKFPGVRWASDQAYREYDLAIDFCEDV
ncbi:MAG: HAD hydrolase family protein, partial [Bdellovibrionota bacterium]